MGKQQIEKAPNKAWFIVNKILLSIFCVSALAALVSFIIIVLNKLSLDGNNPSLGQFVIATFFLFIISFIACILYTLFLPKEVKYRQFGKIFWGVFLGSALGFAILPEKFWNIYYPLKRIYSVLVFVVFVISFIACILHALFLPKKTKWRQLGWIFLVTLLSFAPLLIKSISSYIRSSFQERASIGETMYGNSFQDTMN